MTEPAPDLDPIEAPDQPATEVAASPATSNPEPVSVGEQPEPEPRPDDPGRLTVAQALAELDRQPAAILAIEAQHGFTFGNPDNETGPGGPTVAAVCSTAGCDRQGRLVQLHSDTVQPLHCGTCAAVIHCDHDPELLTEGGNLEDPVQHQITRCTTCDTELDRQSRTLAGAELLAQLPAGYRAALEHLAGN